MVQYKAIPIRVTTEEVLEDDWKRVVDNATLHQNCLAVFALNSTGSALVAGDVVVFDTTADGVVVMTATPGDSRKVGVVQDPTVALDVPCWVAIHGHVPALRVKATIGRQVALQTSDTNKAAQAGAGNSFGVTLTGRTGAGVVEAFIHNAGVASAHVIKDLTTTFAQRSNLRLGDGFNVQDVPGSDETLVTAGFPVGPVSASHGPVSFNYTDATLHANQIAAPASGSAIYVTSIAAWNQVATATRLDGIEHGGSTRFKARIAGADGAGFVHAFDPPWELPDATALDFQCSIAADVLVEVNFYVKPVSP